CVKCRAIDRMTRVPMADVPATIATFTVDRLAFSPSPPVVAAVIDFEGGGRFQCELTDVDPKQVKIGDRVEMTFRRLLTADGVHNYFWKARPPRLAPPVCPWHAWASMSSRTDVRSQRRTLLGGSSHENRRVGRPPVGFRHLRDPSERSGRGSSGHRGVLH